MHQDSFKQFRRKNYNSMFAQKWKKTEDAVCRPEFPTSGLYNVSNLSISNLHQKIRESLPLAACDLLRLLILANTKLTYYKTDIRYSGRFVVAVHKSYPAYHNEEKRRKQKENEQIKWLEYDPTVLAFFETIGKSPFYQALNPSSPTEPIESFFSAQYDDLLNAMIDDALVRYLSNHPKTSLAGDMINYIFSRLKSKECIEATQKIIPFQQTGKKDSIAQNRIAGVVLTSYLPYLYENSTSSLLKNTSWSLWHNSAYLPSVLQYLLHHPQDLLLNWKDISSYKDSQITDSFDFVQKLPKDLSNPQKIQALLNRMEASILTPLFDDKKGKKWITQWHELECKLLSIFQKSSSEMSDVQLEFLNYFNAPYTAKRQIASSFASNYISHNIPTDDRLDAQIQIAKKQFETITRLGQAEIDENGTIKEDYRDEGRILHRNQFSKKTRVPVFSSKISFFTQSDKVVYDRITEQPSNFMNLWGLFCLLQPPVDENISSAIGFNRSVALDAFNNLSGTVDLVFHTGIPSSCCPQGFGTNGCSIELIGRDDNYPDAITLVGYPFELWCSGLKTKFTMLKHGILAHIEDVMCINNIIDWIYNCLCQSHVNADQLRSFEPYDDIYEFINLLGKDKAESCADDAIYKPVRPSLTNEGIF